MAVLARDTIVAKARTWLGAPYRHQGRARETGLDCIGLILVVWDQLGLEPIHVPMTYAPSPNKDFLLRYANKHLIPQERTEFKKGDVLTFWGWNRHEPQHFAIVGEHDRSLTMIHAFSKHGKVLEQPFSRFWLRRVEKVYCYPGTEA